MAKSVSIVIPTFNGGALFGEVLAKLRTQRYELPIELVVIDSGSADETVAMARQAGAVVHEIPSAEFDHGETRNRAIGLTRGEIVVLMTQDAVPADEHLVAALVAAFDDPQVGGAFARQLPRESADVLVKRNVSSWIAGLPTGRLSRIENREAYERESPMERFLRCVFDNVCSAVRRETWEKIPFRRMVFGEDVDWSKRALEAGWAISYQPAAMVVHSHDRSAWYEYKRTYMCHRMLYSLFQLQTVPTWRHVWRSIVYATTTDARYVWANEKSQALRISLLMQVPALSVASVLGQFYGARDQRLNRGKKQRGV